MIQLMLLIFTLIFYLSTLMTVSGFMLRLPSTFNKESSLSYKTKPYNENEGVITVVPNFPSVPDHIKNVYIVTTLNQYDEILKEQKDKIIVTRFFMTNCKACVAMTPSFYRLVRSKPHIIFVDIPISKENNDIHLKLGIETVPFAHINHPNFGLVEERKISRKHWEEFEGVILSYEDGECPVTQEDCSNPFRADLKLDPNYF